MYIFDRKYDHDFYASKPFNHYFKGAHIGVVDIETTGLSPARNKCILGGIAEPTSDQKIRVRQYLAESRAEEGEMLRLYKEALDKCDLIIGYNSNSFDLPFIENRLKVNGLDGLGNYTSFDLYNIINKHTKLRDLLGNLRQKTIEVFLGIDKFREDEIGGDESVILYNEYEVSKDDRLRDYILLHNRDDLMQLARILRILDKLDLSKIVFQTGFPVINNLQAFYVKKINMTRKFLRVRGVHNLGLAGRYFSGPYDLLAGSDKSFNLDILCEFEENSLFTDIGDMIIEDSIGRYLLLKENDRVEYASINNLIMTILQEYNKKD